MCLFGDFRYLSNELFEAVILESCSFLPILTKKLLNELVISCLFVIFSFSIVIESILSFLLFRFLFKMLLIIFHVDLKGKSSPESS